MISAIIVLALLSLLVATEPDTAGSAAHPAPVPPLQATGKKPPAEPVNPDRLAA